MDEDESAQTVPDDEFGAELLDQDGPDLFGSDAPAPEPVPEPPRPTEPVAASAVSDVPQPPLALYRRYRPETFDEVIGQEHVTEPLKRALLNNRVNHAYLFSGPRGCGKTTSARILARCLNCEKGPTPTPCGECQSCRDLARGGGGSIDVIEIDAASHGGVDDARDLRERAFFAPVQSRYKIYIVDEAHMVTTAGFNAMLKLVEEPPPHVKFIFATTEPDKVIGTIRSRTHHYPFRLVPPKVLSNYLAELCELEHVTVAPGVLPLVVRAGAGSVRDSLSVLDQLLGAADEDGVSYEQAAGLLGYTPDSLLDDIMTAFAAGDSAGVFSTIDRVIEVGQDPRRFAEDLLRRLRDLVILSAVPTATTNGLLDVSPDQADRLQAQAAGMGRGELTRAAEVIATGLTAMRGTTAPRLHLELMCSRVLLPGADVDDRGIYARLERLERRVALGVAEGVAAPVAEPSPPARPNPEPRIPAPAADMRPDRSPEHDAAPESGVPAEQPAPRGQRPAGQRPVSQRPAGQRPAARPAEARSPEARTVQPRPAASAPEPAVENRPAGLTAADLRREWPRVLEAVKERRRFAWMLLSQNAQVLDLANGELVLGFSSQGARDNFANGGSSDVLRDCLVSILMLDVVVRAVADAPMPPEDRSVPAPTPPPDEPPAEEHVRPAAPEPPAPAPVPAQQRPAGADPVQPHASRPAEDSPPPDDDVSADDDVLVDDAASASDLVITELGGQVIPDDEI